MLRLYSASKLKTFSACSRQFYFKYIEHIETEAGARAVLGRCVHKAIELGFQGEDALKVYATEWAEQSKVIKDRKGITKIYDEGMKMLLNYKFYPMPTEVELGFELPFPDAENPICMMQGYIDQIFDGDIIVDLKTGLRKPLQGVLDNSAQFIIYHWAYKQMFGGEPSIYWHHLRTGDMIRADVASPDKLQHVINLVKDTNALRDLGEEIALYHKNVGFECSFCGHRKICLGTDT